MSAVLDLSDFSGPHHLTIQGITLAVATITPGVYVLGESNTTGRFVAKAIGRSDAHLRARLWSVVGRYPDFLYRPCKTPAEAYLLECELFHCLEIRGAGSHPCPPDDVDSTCPYCTQSQE